MTIHDPLIDSLNALCQREGGLDAVAERLHVNKHGLWQVLHRTPLPSGNPRGLSSAMRKRLDTAFPGWLAAATAAPVEQVDLVAGIRQLVLAIAPERRQYALMAASQVLIGFLSQYPSSAPPPDGPSGTPGDAPRT